ncbi:peptidoglycan recognition protein 1-like [Gigantopelta aegis]|uniref:peptidoglycan recognition protein 1-like n=1 Tax=Gigantopelta aegis TaxID=1735272 RepID=UPI001B887C3B|nr:peptidoglycan recognition protein 1-like [Gigantopelta aegis]
MLSGPSCLPYKGRQSSSPDGAIHAVVDFNGQDAWVDTSQIYIKECNVSFQCVCAIEDTTLRALASDSSPSNGHLQQAECLSITDTSREQHVAGWTSVVTATLNPAWVKNAHVAFHDQCTGLGLPTFKPATQLSGCPNIVTREEWGARQPISTSLLPATPQFLVVHHGATPTCKTREQCIRLVKSYQDYHMDGHGWDDIAYSFLVGEDGNVYEGRGWTRHGSHTRHYNDVALGFCVIGNFMDRPPNHKALRALHQLIGCTTRNHKVRSDYTLLGHRDTNPHTLCPGDKLHDVITRWPHFNFNNARVS